MVLLVRLIKSKVITSNNSLLSVVFFASARLGVVLGGRGWRR